MSKRTAQGPQGAKETGIDFNMSSMPDDKPQRATAAQLANRKIKAINRRTRPSSPATTSTTQQSFSPFTSLDPNTVSSTSGGSQPASLSNSFTFGQSQSFPGASSNPATSGTQPVAFGAGGGSSFNFSSSFDTGTSVSNPFASMNGGNSNQPSGGPGFGGFKGSLFNLPPANQTQNQQPAASSGLFGAQPQQNGTGSVFGGFGNNTSTTSASPFQSTPSAAPSTGGLFSQSTSQTTAPASGLFGQTNANKPTLFGNSTAFSAPSDSMQTSPDAKAGAVKPLFGAGATSQPPPTFGAFGSSSDKPLFATSTTENKTSFSTEKTPQSPFGAKPAESSTSTTTTAGSSLFGRISQPETSAAATSSSMPASVATTTAAASTPSLFGTSTSTAASAPTFQPFQSSSNLFPGPSKPATPQPAPASGGLFSFNQTKTEEPKAPITTAEPKNDDNAPKPSGGLFGTTSSFGQPPATNIFAPKPASTTDQAPAQTTAANPFSGLFAMKPAAPPSPAQEKPPASPFQPSNLFAPKPEITAADSAPAPKRTAGEGDTSAPKRPSLFGAAPSASLSPSTSSASSTSSVTTNGPGLFTIKGAVSTTSTSANVPASKPDVTVSKDKTSPSKLTFGAKGPRGLPSNLSKELNDDVELLYRVRMLNESFKRKISELDPSKDDFDVVISFYMRVRETIGAPIGDAQSATSKRKTRDEERIETETPSQKKVKPAATPTDQSKPTPATGLFSTSPVKLAASNDSLASNKRKAADDADSISVSSAQPEKRASTSQASGSTTASIFASSFSGSPETTADAKAPEASNASLTPAFKPLFPSSGTSAASSTQSPFTLKPSTEKPKESPAKPAFEIPKFGAGTATNFLSQFKQQADKNAEKEKEKRKAEDFDSDEDDEAEWERKDAEEQRKKRETFEALAKKRAKFVPGKGFVFEDDEAKEEPAPSPQPSEKTPAPALAPTSSSIFQNAGSRSPPKSGNIFGHLSAANSEAEAEEDDDSDKGSADGDVSAEAGPKSLPAPPTEGSGDSSDDGDISKALKKKSEEAAAARKDAAGAATPSTAPTPQSGRSLFDRIQYDPDGKPKREAQPSEENKESGTNVSTLFGNSKVPSFNASSNGSPGLFSSSIQSTSSQDNASTPKAGSLFGSSLNASGGLFGSPTPAAPGASSTTSASDHTWKIDSPIKFASTTSASEPSSGTGTAGDSKPFSTLFGGSSAQKSTATSNGGSQLGFVFGGPSQGASSLFPSSTGASATPSGATTPAAASDTGADDSADGDAAPAEPQVDLARSRAGEEEEDIQLETRARALKLEPGSGWQSQGVGWLRILKHRTTSRSRVILRADPSGKVILNASLLPQITYKEAGTSVQFLVPKAEGAPEQWAIRVKKEEVSRLATTMEESKA